MMMTKPQTPSRLIALLAPLLLLFSICQAQTRNAPLRGPPQFETNPQYLDSYIPASMQVIAYLTEMMKYDIKPTIPLTTTVRPKPPVTWTPAPPKPPVTWTQVPWKPAVSSTVAPTTSSHRPGLYSPYKPPRVHAFRIPLSSSPEEEGNFAVYVNRLRNPLGTGYFDRYRTVDPIKEIIGQLQRSRRAVPFKYDPKNVGSSTRRTPSSSGAVGKSKLRKRAVPFKYESQGVVTTGRTPSGSGASGKSKVKKSASSGGNGKGKQKRAMPFQYDPSNQSDNAKLKPNHSFVSLSQSKKKKTAANRGGGRSKQRRRRSTSDTANLQQARLASSGGLLVDNVNYLAPGPSALIKEIADIEENPHQQVVDENRLTEEDKVRLFATKFDDSDFTSQLLRQKRIPPTKAYVTLLSLYDLLNKESKKLALNKYNGYSTAVIEELMETSGGTSSAQLRTILAQIRDRPDTREDAIIRKITALVADLDQTNSYINDALRYIPPLPFLS